MEGSEKTPNEPAKGNVTPAATPVPAAATPAQPTKAVAATPATPGATPAAAAATPASPTKAVAATPATPGASPVAIAATTAKPAQAVAATPATPGAASAAEVTTFADSPFLRRMRDDLEARKNLKEGRLDAKQAEIDAICTFQPKVASGVKRRMKTNIWDSLYNRGILREERFAETQQKRISELEEEEVKECTFQPADGKNMWRAQIEELKHKDDNVDSITQQRGLFRCSTAKGRLQGNLRSCTDVYGQLFEPMRWEPSRQNAPQKIDTATILEAPGRPPGQPMDDPNSLEPRKLFRRAFLRYGKQEQWRRARLEEILNEEAEACTFQPDMVKVRKETLVRPEPQKPRKRNKALANPRRRIDVVKPLFVQIAEVRNFRKDDPDENICFRV